MDNEENIEIRIRYENRDAFPAKAVAETIEQINPSVA